MASGAQTARARAPETHAVAALAPAAGLSLLALACGHFAVDCCTGVWPVFKTLAHLDLTRAGFIATAAGMAGNGLQIVFGVLADGGRRKALLLCGVGLAGGVTLLPFAGSYPAMFALVLVTYVGSAAFHPSAAGAATAIARVRTGLTIGLFMAGGYLGYAVSQVVFSSIFTAAAHLTPAILALPALAAGAIASWVPAAPGGRRKAAGETWAALRPHAARIAALFAVQVFTTGINLSFIFLLPDLLQSRGAPGWMVQGGGHFALVAGGCLSLLPAGHAADRWGARRVLVVANVASLLLLFALLSRHGASGLDLALVALFGGCNGMNNVVAVAEGNRTLPGRTSAASALLMGTPWCLAALGPSLAGLLANPATGGTPTRALAWLSLAIPLSLAVSARVGPRTSR